jgi:hypothetical protein
MLVTARRFAVLSLALTAVGAAGAVPAAQADSTASLTASMTSRGPVVGGMRPVNLLVNAQISDPAGPGFVPIPERFTFRFPKLRLNTAKFPVCTANDNQLVKDGAAACPAASRVGVGSARVWALRTLGIDADVYIYNGRKTAKGRELLLLTITRTVEQSLALRGLLKPLKGGKYGWTLSFGVPEIPVIDNELAALQLFNIKLGAQRRVRGKRLSYVEAPKSCPKAGLPVTFEELVRTTGATLPAAATIVCPAR